ncbi:MAG TPA: metallophosphoesterase family protein, partial [Roseiflexaceae bacterium]|nr:metallophosphoesterase family protein [Roseiflexaceae bacterium]
MGQLTKTYPRLWTLGSGTVMVVTDLHGDWEAYAHCRDRFVEQHANGQADWLVLTGDLIHREPGDGPDRSLDIVLDILALRETFGDAIIVLCGNHELPHLYGLVLRKGATTYTSPFEMALSASGRRADVLEFFDALPFYVRTAAGVSIAHAG